MKHDDGRNWWVYALALAKHGCDGQVQAAVLLSTCVGQQLYKLRRAIGTTGNCASRGTTRPSPEWSALPAAEQQAQTMHLRGLAAAPVASLCQ